MQVGNHRVAVRTPADLQQVATLVERLGSAAGPEASAPRYLLEEIDVRELEELLFGDG